MAFFQKTPCGFVSVNVNPVRMDGNVRFSISGAISLTYVQEILEKTALYDFDDGMTWSCGMELANFERYADWIAPRTALQNAAAKIGIGSTVREWGGYLNDYMPADADDTVIDTQVSRLLGRIEKTALPFLQIYGFSEEAFLNLCTRNDKFVEICFGRLQQQALAGLLLAQKLWRPETAKTIKQNMERKGNYYAKLGNPEPLQVYMKIGKELGLL